MSDPSALVDVWGFDRVLTGDDMLSDGFGVPPGEVVGLRSRQGERRGGWKTRDATDVE